jgi:hypothetical protein
MPNRRPDEDRSLPPNDWTSAPESGSTPAGFFTLRQILDRELPDPADLAETELIRLLNAIELELLEHAVKVDFLDALPARVAYRGILQLLDSPIQRSESPYVIAHVDGCDSACESCFQLAHCPVAREILGGEWSLAVEQAGINPSWSALYASDDGE